MLSLVPEPGSLVLFSSVC